MNMRKTGLLLTGGLAVMLVVFIVAYGILLATETMPLHLEVKEPITSINSNALPESIALPRVVESVDPEYLLTNIYTVAHAPTPVFTMVDTDASADIVDPNGEIRLGRHPGTVIEFQTAPANVTVDGDPLGGDPVPPVGVVVIKSGPSETVIIPGVGSRGGSVDPRLPGDTSDNTAQLNLYSVSVLNVGWTDISVSGGAAPVGDAVPIAPGARVVITGGTTTIVGLSNGVDTCQTRVIVGRTRAPSTPPPTDPIWVDFSGKAIGGSHIRAAVNDLARDQPDRRRSGCAPRRHRSGHQRRDSAEPGRYARHHADATAMRLASIPLPTIAGDPDDGLVALSLQVRVRGLHCQPTAIPRTFGKCSL